MTCIVFKRCLALHAGGDLPAAIAARVDHHVAQCARCAAELSRHRASLRLFGSLRSEEEVDDAPAPLGENFWLHIRRDLRSNGLVGDRAVVRRTSFAWLRAFDGLAVRSALAVSAVALAVVLVEPWKRDESAADPHRVVVTPPVRVTPVADRGGVRIEPRALPGQGDPRGADPRRGWVGDAQPFAPPAVEYHLEGWQSPERERDVLDF